MTLIGDGSMIDYVDYQTLAGIHMSPYYHSFIF